MATEIERKFIVTSTAWRTPEVLATGKRIRQAYFTVDGGDFVQLSQNGDDHRLVIARRDATGTLDSVTLPVSASVWDDFNTDADAEGFLPVGNGFKARARLKAGEGTVTIKTDGTIERGEFEGGLEGSVVTSIFDGTFGANVIEGFIIDKTRYKAVLESGHTAEIDVYDEANAGLVVAEVEQQSIGETLAFTEWLREENEVTDDKRYKNKNLARAPYSTWDVGSSGLDRVGL